MKLHLWEISHRNFAGKEILIMTAHIFYFPTYAPGKAFQDSRTDNFYLYMR